MDVLREDPRPPHRLPSLPGQPQQRQIGGHPEDEADQPVVDQDAQVVVVRVAGAVERQRVGQGVGRPRAVTDHRPLLEPAPVRRPERVAAGHVHAEPADLGRVAVEEALVQWRI